jgi:structure-specific recognition protein 1
MLEKFIFFVSKQPVLIEISDIHQVVFSRVGAGIATARTFDMQIITKQGPEYTFTSINKEEHEPTDAYLKDKKVRVKNEMVPDGDLLLAAGADDSDEEMQSVASDDDEEPRVRRARDDDDESEEGKRQHAFMYLPAPLPDPLTSFFFLWDPIYRR